MAHIGTLKTDSPGQEYALLEFVDRLERYREGRIAVHVHLSRLQAHNRREQYIRLAFSTFDNFVAQQEGHTYMLRNKDIVFIGRADAAKHIEEAVIRLRYLFSEDALIQNAEDSDETGFCTWYVLERDYPKFLEVCRRLHQLTQTRLPPDLGGPEPARVPINAKILAKLEEQLIGADLTNLIRNQAVYAIGADRDPSPVFHEVYVSIADLESAVMPRVQLTGNPWLFQYLTQSLDKRMLSYLSREWEAQRAFSINLNVSTLLSPEFLKFDQQISSTARGRLVIEIQKVDIFGDMGAYAFAREYARERGYRLCLDGMTHLTLPFIDREKLGLDLVKLMWSPELARPDNARLLEDLRACVAACGVARVILAHCDSPESVEIGKSLGIALYQGRHIDRKAQQARANLQVPRLRR